MPGRPADIQIYGWANTGFNVSTSDHGKFANAPAAYAQVPDSIQLDQLTLYVEKVPDTIQTDHFDWGFRFTDLYGTGLPLHHFQGDLQQPTDRREQ